MYMESAEELAMNETRIMRIRIGNEVIVLAALDDSAALDHTYHVGVLDRGQSMRNDEYGLVLHQPLKGLLDEVLGF